MTMTKTNAFNDKECTCKCGNKHEAYGGIGYTTTLLSSNIANFGKYTHYVKCNKCSEISKLEY